MAFDPIHQTQLQVRRGAQLLRSNGVLPGVPHERPHLEGEERDRFFDTGYKQVASLAEQIEAHTGCTIDGRTALDYGCGVGRTALPLAERCEHVYGLDLSLPMMESAQRSAERMNIDNVEWLEAGRLAELAGRYDLVISMFVFQHIPSREGERIFATILSGLRPGGVGAVHFTIRPAHLIRNVVRGLDWSYAYMLMNSYSLNRLGALLVEAGVSEWRVRWHSAPIGESQQRPYPSGTIVFKKD